MKFLLVATLTLFCALTGAWAQGFGCNDGYLPDDERVDCSPGEPTDEMQCRSKNCTWCPADEGGNIPWCYLSRTPSVGGYLIVGEPVPIENGLRVNLRKAPEEHTIGDSPSPAAWEGEAPTLTMDAYFHSDYRLRVKFYNTTDRFEVPLEIQPATGGNSNPLYDIQFKSDPLFSFQVVRKSPGTVLFDSSPGKFIFADQYLTMSWVPGSEHVYGIGENEQKSFRHDFNESITWGLYSRALPAFCP